VTNAIPPEPTGPTGPTGPGQPVLQIRLFPNTAVGSFSWFPMPSSSTGLVDYGNGTLVPWEQDYMSPQPFIGSVPTNGVVSIYSDDIRALTLNTQPIRSITIINAPLLTSLTCTDNKLVGCVDLRSVNPQFADFTNNYINGVLLPSSPNQARFIWLSNNLINQANAESIALQLMSSSAPSGSLVIRTQRNGVLLNITTTPFLNLISKGWTVS
jgi:hypothetical protein